MAYSLFAEKYGGYGRLRGSGAFMTLSGDRPAAGLSNLPAGVLAGPPGAVVVGPELARAMAVFSSRGNGPTGTRHTVTPIRGGAVPPTPRVDSGRGQDYVVGRGTSTGSNLGQVQMRAGTSRAVPNGKGFQMYSATIRYGLGTTEDEAGSRLGTPKQPNEWITPSSPNSLWDCNSKTHKRACEIGQPGMEGACRPCGTPFGVPSAGNDTGSRVYRNALSAIQTLYDQIRNAQINPQTALPGELGTLAAPPADASAAEKSAWDDFRYIRDTALPIGRREGQILWDAEHAAPPAPPITPPPVTPGTTPPTTTVPVGTIQQGANGQSYRWDGTTWVLYVAGSPTDVNPGGGGATFVGPTLYPDDPTIPPTQAGTGRVYPPTPVPAADDSVKPKSHKAGVGIGVVAILGIGLFAWSRRKKRKAA